MGASVTHTSSFAFTPPAVFDAMYRALASMATVRQVDAERLYVAGTAGVSVASWGERIQVWVTPGSPETIVTVESRCKLPMQLVDWGRNRRNVNRLLKAANVLLSSG